MTLYTAPRGPAVRLDGEILDVVDRSDIDIGMSSLSSAWAVGREGVAGGRAEEGR